MECLVYSACTSWFSRVSSSDLGRYMIADLSGFHALSKIIITDRLKSMNLPGKKESFFFFNVNNNCKNAAGFFKNSKTFKKLFKLFTFFFLDY